jgi:carbon monoxide dehydrogenase subunit G
MAMLLKNEFEVHAGVDEAWDFFTDLARVMPCMPGAALDGVEGESYLGNVKIKVGPIGAHFQGTAHFAQKDDAAHTAVIVAAGKDPKGQAAVNAQIHARLEPVTSTRTRVLIDTDLDISGRMAQFGRGAIADVSNRLLGQFVANISEVIGSGPPATASATAPPSAPRTTPVASTTPGSSASDEAGMDVLGLVVPMIKDRYGQAIVGGLIGFVLSWLVFGRHVRRNAAAQPPWAVPWPGPWPPDEQR